MRMTPGKALAKYGVVSFLAALGTIEKNGNTDKVRVISDATHRFLINHAIKARHQVRKPISVDVKAVMTEMAAGGGPTSRSRTTSDLLSGRFWLMSQSWVDSAVRSNGPAAG